MGGAVELEDVFRTGGVMQPVDVLGDESPDVSLALKRRQGVVRGVRPGTFGETLPPDERTRPVSSSVLVGAHEVLVRHWLKSGGVAPSRGPVVGDGALGADSGAGDDEEALGPRDEIGERANLLSGGGIAVGGGQGATSVRRSEGLAMGRHLLQATAVLPPTRGGDTGRENHRAAVQRRGDDRHDDVADGRRANAETARVDVAKDGVSGAHWMNA